MKILIAVNAIAALAMLIMFPFYSGGRSLLYLCAGLVHAGLSFGLMRNYGWARVTMIGYALFQVAGLGSWSLIGIMTLIAEPMTIEKTQFLIFSAIAIPFLIWAAIYLLREMQREPVPADD